MPETNKLSWSERFDKKFDHKNQSKGFCNFDCENDYSLEDIKSFFLSDFRDILLRYSARIKKEVLAKILEEI